MTRALFLSVLNNMLRLALRSKCQRPMGMSRVFVRSFLTSNISLNSNSARTLLPPEPEAEPKQKPNFLKRYLKYFFLGSGVISGTLTLIVAGIFVYDYTTYTPPAVPEQLLVPMEAINPKRGGPENLPILTRHLDDLDTEAKRNHEGKEKLVILGSGWGAISILSQLDKEDYDVTVISPNNYFLFTPMLPSAAVGTLEIKTLMESIRSLVNRVNGHFLKGFAEKVEFSNNLIKVKDPKTGAQFYVPYDKLVVAVGSISNTHGVSGLEYTHQLKTAEDALAIRKAFLNNLETACLPTTSEAERKRLLSFVVCGGGPTGVEVAAEIFDVINEDVPKLYPMLLRKDISIHIIQSRSHILNTYDQKISEYAMKRFFHDDIDLLINSRVKEILPDRVIFNQKDENGNVIEKEIIFGLCLWSTGVGLNPLTDQMVNDLKPVQMNKRALETDHHLRVIGAPLGSVYAIGDCSTVRTDLANHCEDHIRQYLLKHHKHAQEGHLIVTDEDIHACRLSFQEVDVLFREVGKKYPLAREALELAKELVPMYDQTNKGSLNFKQLQMLFTEVNSKITSLPATAQRAHQEGSYLGKKLHKLANHKEIDLDDFHTCADIDEAICKPFSYNHMGSLAYLGNSAVFDLPGYSFVGGLIAMYLWRSVYFAQSVSLRTRLLFFVDWLKRGIFGRDLLSV